MTSLQVVVDNANQHFENISAFYVQHILPYVKGRSSKTYIAAAIAAFFSYRVYRVVHVPKKLRHIPAVPFWPYMRSVLSGEGIDVRTRKVILPVLAKSPNGLYLRPNQRGWSVGVAAPSAMKTLFLRIGDYPKDAKLLRNPHSLAIKFIGAENIVGINGAVWKKHRMIANPAFHRSMPVKLFGKLSERMMLKFDKEGDGLENVDIPNFLQRFTLDIIGLAAFGYDFEALDKPGNDKVNTYDDILVGVRNPLHFFFPILDKSFLWAMPKRRELHERLGAMNNVFNDIIENKRKTLAKLKDSIEDAEKDLLTLMLEANEESNDADHRLSNSELRADLVVFFVAGHDTTSNALSFALYHLAVNPVSQFLNAISTEVSTFLPALPVKTIVLIQFAAA
ncbi:unnamed protein product [Umbelopsis ramanniana]